MEQFAVLVLDRVEELVSYGYGDVLYRMWV